MTNNYFVATNIILSQQNFCHDKHTFVVTKDLFCHDKHICHDKTFVTTKMILVAAPANDKIWVSSPCAILEVPVTNWRSNRLDTERCGHQGEIQTTKRCQNQHVRTWHKQRTAEVTSLPPWRGKRGGWFSTRGWPLHLHYLWHLGC